MTAHQTLRAANAARQAEWDPSDQITLSYRGNELGGECGEAQNEIKKLERERLGIRGSRTTIAKLAEELADVVICADLIAMAEGIDLDRAVASKFNATSEKVGLATRLEVAPRSATERIDELLEANNTYLQRARDAEALKAALTAHEDITESCGICRHPFVEGVLTLFDVTEGEVHAECCGPERDSYVNADGDPLGPDDPIPTGTPWTPAFAANGEVETYHAKRIAEVMDEGDGHWRACSGCQEGVDGYVSSRDYPFNKVFRCQPGGGCSECGGLGVIWDNIDYDQMAREMIADGALQTHPSQQADPVPPEWTGQGTDADFFEKPEPKP